MVLIAAVRSRQGRTTWRHLDLAVEGSWVILVQVFSMECGGWKPVWTGSRTDLKEEKKVGLWEYAICSRSEGWGKGRKETRGNGQGGTIKGW